MIATAPTGRIAPWHTRFPRLLAGSVFLPLAAFTEPRATLVRAAGGSPWIALWTEGDGMGTPPWPTTPDGVTEDVVPLCVAAGVESMVVGRALLASSKGSTT
jgi:hypothetical protein